MGWLFCNPDRPRPESSCPAAVTNLATYPEIKPGPPKANSFINLLQSHLKEKRKCKGIQKLVAVCQRLFGGPVKNRKWNWVISGPIKIPVNGSFAGLLAAHAISTVNTFVDCLQKKFST